MPSGTSRCGNGQTVCVCASACDLSAIVHNVMSADKWCPRGSDLPFIKFLHHITSCSVQDTHKMNENCFPYSEFKLMKKVHYKQDKQIEGKFGKSLGKCVLRFDQYGSHNMIHDVKLTRVGTKDLSFRILFTHVPETGAPFSNMRARAFLTWRRESSSTRCSFSCRLKSNFVPIFGMSDFFVRQRGHGHLPKNLMLASKTLERMGQRWCRRKGLVRMMYFSG